MPRRRRPPAELVSLGAVYGSRTCQVPRNQPRVTVFAAERAKGDVLGPDSVSLGASRGGRALQVARDLPRATAEAAEQLKGDFSGHAAFALGSFHDTRGLKRLKGDNPRSLPAYLAPGRAKTPGVRLRRQPGEVRLQCLTACRLGHRGSVDTQQRERQSGDSLLRQQSKRSLGLVC